MPRCPLRKASAIAIGISASACTTFARFSWTAACISCSLATAKARRSSALARATRVSASGWRARGVRADVIPDVDVGDVDRQNLVSGAGVQPFLEHAFGDRVRLFQYLQMSFGR